VHRGETDRAVDQSSRSPVRYDALVLRVQKEILRLDVVVNEAGIVSTSDTVAGLSNPSDCGIDREAKGARGRDLVGNAAVRGERRNKVWLTEVIVSVADREDVVILEVA
jgi:hypothetical protein